MTFSLCSCSVSDLLIFGHFFQLFYFKELVKKELKLSLPEDRSSRHSGSVINRIMTCFVVVTLEK